MSTLLERGAGDVPKHGSYKLKHEASLLQFFLVKAVLFLPGMAAFFIAQRFVAVGIFSLNLKGSKKSAMIKTALLWSWVTLLSFKVCAT